jgi:ferredoxin
LDRLIVEKASFAGWIERLLGSHQVVAPVAQPDLPAALHLAQAGGTLRFRAVTAPDQVVLNGGKAMRSPKEHLIPQTEGLLTFGGAGAGMTLAALGLQPTPRVILGARPCDARACATLDDVFLARDPKDTRYGVRRDNTLMIGLACNKPGWGCFCTTVGGSPAGTDGSDLLLTDLGDRYHVAVVTDAGRALVQDSGFGKAKGPDREAAEALHQQAATQMQTAFDLPLTLASLEWESPLWERYARRCLGCGICTFLCPTCHCFDIQDETTARGGFRYRCWDTCQFGEFTQQGHGHNPRPSQKERVRQRLLHKYKYLVTEFDRVGCTGCGRCVEACPVNIDIRELLAQAPGGRQEVEDPK